jgi:hypothetical protein
MKSAFKNLDTIQLVGFLASTCASLALLFTGQDELSSVTLGFVLAAFTQMFDIQKRLGDSEARLLSASALSQTLYKDEKLLKKIEGVINDYQRVKTWRFELFEQYADNELTECRDVMHSLAEGYMTVGDRSLFAFGASGIKYAKSSLKAMTTSGENFWSNVNGETYLLANAEAVKQGVKVIRVFLNSSANLQDMHDVMKRQQDMGIAVYVLSTDETPKKFHEDFVIMDDYFLNRAEFTGTGHVRQWIQSLDPVDVEQACKKFDIIMRSARRLADVPNQSSS